MHRRQRYGFTLLELIIALIIIAGLATLGIQQYQNMVWKARFAEVYQNIGILVRAQRMYYLMHGQYTVNDTSNCYLGNGYPAGSTNVQKQLGVSFPQNSLFIYLVYPSTIYPNTTNIYFGQPGSGYTWCWVYNYASGSWYDYTNNPADDQGPGCKYFTPPASTY